MVICLGKVTLNLLWRIVLRQMMRVEASLISEADEGAGEGIVEALKKVVKGEEGNVVHVTSQPAFQGAVAANMVSANQPSERDVFVAKDCGFDFGASAGELTFNPKPLSCFCSQ